MTRWISELAQKLTVAAVVALTPAAAHAQRDDPGLARLMRECRALADAGRRTACYDAIPLDGSARQEPAARPPAADRPASAAGFGSNQLPRPPDADASGPDRITARVAQAVERQPGLWLLTLEDGSQWQFVDSAPATYDPPRAGSSVEIVRASMGSYLVRYAGQRSVRSRRVR